MPGDFDHYEKDLAVDGTNYHLMINDMGGQPEMKQLRQITYEGAQVFIVCFALNEKKTLNAVPNFWIPEINEKCPDVVRILVGCKSDIAQIDESVYEKVKEENGFASVIECSAAEADNVEEVFYEVVESFVKGMTPQKCGAPVPDTKVNAPIV